MSLSMATAEEISTIIEDREWNNWELEGYTKEIGKVIGELVRSIHPSIHTQLYLIINNIAVVLGGSFGMGGEMR